MKEKESKNFMSIITMGTQIVSMLVAPVFICLLLGIWLDKLLHTTPWLLITGVVVGFSASIWNVYSTTIKKNS